jgi:hypothetical protein
VATEENEVEEGGRIITELLYCVFDKERECGAECMAYVTHPREARDDLTMAQRHCVVLSSVEKLARHSTVIAKVMADKIKFDKTKKQDEQRESSLGDGPFASSPFPLPKKDQP